MESPPEELLTPFSLPHDVSSLLARMIIAHDSGIENVHFEPIFLFLLSVSLQCSILFLAWAGMSEKIIHSYQDHLPEKMAALDACLWQKPLPRSLNTSVPIEAGAFELCAESPNLSYAVLIIVFLWTCRAATEMQTECQLIHVICQVPTSDVTEMFELGAHHTHKSHYEINALSPRARGLVLICVCTVRLVIGAMTLFAGTQMLYYASVATMILKSLGLVFVLTIDGLLYDALVPDRGPSGKRRISFTVLNYVFVRSQFWDHYSMRIKSFTYLVWAVVYCWWMNGAISAYRSACWEYFEHFPRNGCSDCGFHIFGHLLMPALS